MIWKKSLKKTNQKIKKKKNLRKTKRNLSWLKNSLSVILLVAVLLGGFTFIFSDYFKIKHISCSKNDLPCDEEEEEFLQDSIGKNIFLQDVNEVKLKIKDRLRYVKDLEISKSYPNSMIVTIIERKPASIFYKDNGLKYYVDESGYVFNKSFDGADLPEINYSQYNLEIFLGKKIEDDAAVKTIKVADLLKNNFILFNEIKLKSQSELDIILTNNMQVIMSPNKSPDLQVESLQFILRISKIEGKVPAYIDLRFTKPVVKYNL